MTQNEGIAFVQFKDDVCAEFFIEDFELIKKEIPVNKNLQDLGAANWELRIAPPSNDIIWRYVSNRGKFTKTFLRFCSWSLLIIISVVLITPLTIIDNLNPIVELLQTYLGDYTYVKSYIQYFVTPL